MTHSLEQSRSSTSLIPQKKLLIEVRMTLEKRWKEFDAATMQEARNDPKAIFGGLLGKVGDEEIREARDNHEEFQKAKATFDEAKEALAGVKNDTELKVLLKGPGKLSSTIVALESYFAKLKAPEKAKEHNKVLAHTLADLTSLKAQVTNIAEDKRAAEVARGNTSSLATVPTETGEDILAPLEQATPAVATAVAGIGAAVVGTGLISEKSWKSTLTEGFTRFKDWFGGLFGEDTMFGKLFGGIKDRIMGIFTKVGEKLGVKKKVEHTEQFASENSYTVSMKAIDKLFIENTSSEDVASIYHDKRFASLPVITLKNAHTSKDYKMIFTALNITTSEEKEKYRKYIGLILDGIFAGDHGKYIQDAYFREKNPEDSKNQRQKKSITDDITLESYVSTAGMIIKRIKYIPAVMNNKGHEMMGLRMDDKGEWIKDPEGNTQETEIADTLLSKKTLGFTLAGMNDAVYKRGEKQKHLESLSQKTSFLSFCKTPEDQAESKKEMEKIFDFGEKFMQEILDTPDLNMNLSGDFREIFDTKGFSFRGLTLMYIALNGRTDFENMTTIERAQVYGLVIGITTLKDAGSAGALFGKYVKNFEKSESAVPKEVWGFMTSITKKLAGKAVDGVVASVKAFLGFAREAPLEAATLLALITPIIPSRHSFGSYV